MKASSGPTVRVARVTAPNWFNWNQLNIWSSPPPSASVFIDQQAKRIHFLEAIQVGCVDERIGGDRAR